MEQIFSWVMDNRIETIAALLGLISIYFQIKQNPWLWPVSIVMVSMYIFVYYNSLLYAYMSLQFYYLFVSFYGWYYWVFGKKKTADAEDKKPQVKSLTLNGVLKAIGVSVLFFIIILFILKKTNSDVPYIDAFTTGLSFVATWLLARKILENWLFWIVVDIVSVGLFLHKGLYATAILFMVLTILAFVGYFKWKKTMNLKT